MSNTSHAADDDQIVPDSVIPHGQLPPMTYRDLPEPVPIRRMIGPSLLLAGLALGSGEFVLWPYITYKSQFIFFWACLIGAVTQYFLNMEITRWTLATGESAITGFCRISRHFAWIFLLLNIIPWMLPAWATGSAEILSWIVWPPVDDGTGAIVAQNDQYVAPLAIAGLFLCGIVFTLGPVIYETVEKIQLTLISLSFVLMLALTFCLVRGDAVMAQFQSTLTLGYPDFFPQQSEFTKELDPILLLGALAFAGVGGTLNLGQSNYVKDKGYGMGQYIGRITSPITGQVESVSSIGFLFRDTEQNMTRWRQWWRRANIEHLLSFLLTCLVCLVLLTLISYSIFYTADGQLLDGAERYGKGMNFVLGQAEQIGERLGPLARLGFCIMGMTLLLTTEIGVLDGASRISSDIVKVNWLPGHKWWTESRLYYLFLWGMILLGTGILLLKMVGYNVSAFNLFKLTAAMNGGVMFLYSMTLLYLNCRMLPPPLRTSPLRRIILCWSVLFFGFFALFAGWYTIVG